MSISYAGVDLVQLHGDIALFVEKALDLEHGRMFQERFVKSQTLSRLPIPQVNLGYRPRLGSLIWPRDASRWATAWYLASQEQLDAIRAVVFAGEEYLIQTLTLKDSVNPPLTAKMWLLPTYPIVDLPTKSAPLFLLTLVDDRFFWWHRNVSLTINSGITSYPGLYTALGNALGDVTITNDSIPTAYLSPGRAWNMQAEIVPPVLDAVAFSCGQRIVVTLAGAVNAVNASTASETVVNNLVAMGPQMLGGELTLGDSSPTDLGAAIPEAVAIYWPNLDAGTSTTTVAHTTTTFSGNDTKTFRGTGLSISDDVWTPTAALQAFNNQFAADWFLWQQGDSAYTFTGIQPWEPDGLSDRIEWMFRNDVICTRVMRAAMPDATEDLLMALPVPAGSSSSTTYNFSSDTFNYSGLTFFNFVGITVVNVGGPIFQTGYYPITIQTPYEFCSWFCYCSYSFKFSGNLGVWTPPVHTTEYYAEPTSAGLTWSGIVLGSTTPGGSAGTLVAPGTTITFTDGSSTISGTAVGSGSIAVAGGSMALPNQSPNSSLDDGEVDISGGTLNLSGSTITGGHLILTTADLSMNSTSPPLTVGATTLTLSGGSVTLNSSTISSGSFVFSSSTINVVDYVAWVINCGLQLRLKNASETHHFTILDNDTASLVGIPTTTLAPLFMTPVKGQDVDVPPRFVVNLEYDPVVNRLRVLRDFSLLVSGSDTTTAITAVDGLYFEGGNGVSVSVTGPSSKEGTATVSISTGSGTGSLNVVGSPLGDFEPGVSTLTVNYPYEFIDLTGHVTTAIHQVTGDSAGNAAANLYPPGLANGELVFNNKVSSLDENNDPTQSKWCSTTNLWVQQIDVGPLTVTVFLHLGNYIQKASEADAPELWLDTGCPAIASGLDTITTYTPSGHINFSFWGSEFLGLPLSVGDISGGLIPTINDMSVIVKAVVVQNIVYFTVGTDGAGNVSVLTIGGTAPTGESDLYLWEPVTPILISTTNTYGIDEQYGGIRTSTGYYIQDGSGGFTYLGLTADGNSGDHFIGGIYVGSETATTAATTGADLVAGSPALVIGWDSIGLDTTTFHAPIDGGVPQFNSGAGKWKVVNPLTIGPVKVAGADSIGLTGATTITTFTPASLGTFMVGGYVTVLAVVTDVVQFQATYTDERGVSRTAILSAGISSVGAFTFSLVMIRAASSAPINVAAILTTGIGSVSFDAGGAIFQVT